jgi:diphosphomevalonate decarboxylase
VIQGLTTDRQSITNLNLRSRLKTWVATVPSNIAFLKYWGKSDPIAQWPANDSISMTLTNSVSTTSVRLSHDGHHHFLHDRTAISSSEQPTHKAFKHLDFLCNQLKVSRPLIIETKNTFPSDCGIASSASGYGALTLAAVSALLDADSMDDLDSQGVSMETLSNWARMGSGSSCRSFFGGYVIWNRGTTSSTQEVTQLATQDHWPLCDVIVLLSDAKKPMSSSDAHLAAWGSPFFSVRLAGLEHRKQLICAAIRDRKMETLGELIETECLEMHAVAMTGSPPVRYLSDDTSRFLTWVREKRSQGTFPGWFTLDAGPNPHIICEKNDLPSVLSSLKKDWPFVTLISDEVGPGPELSVLESPQDGDIVYV